MPQVHALVVCEHVRDEARDSSGPLRSGNRFTEIKAPRKEFEGIGDSDVRGEVTIGGHGELVATDAGWFGVLARFRSGIPEHEALKVQFTHFAVVRGCGIVVHIRSSQFVALGLQGLSGWRTPRLTPRGSLLSVLRFADGFGDLRKTLPDRVGDVMQTI